MHSVHHSDIFSNGRIAVEPSIAQREGFVGINDRQIREA
jgi:hypothetical protein